MRIRASRNTPASKPFVISILAQRASKQFSAQALGKTFAGATSSPPSGWQPLSKRGPARLAHRSWGLGNTSALLEKGHETAPRVSGPFTRCPRCSIPQKPEWAAHISFIPSFQKETNCSTQPRVSCTGVRRVTVSVFWATCSKVVWEEACDVSSVPNQILMGRKRGPIS